jgi:hyaluronate lyase
MLETGANLVDKALNTVLRGLASGNATELALAGDALSGSNSVFKYVISGDGFYTDGSCVQHAYMPYTGTYGVVALSGLAQMFALLAGSDWAITDTASSMVFDVVENSFSPYLLDGRMLDVVRGRAVSRQGESDCVDGFGTLVAILTLAEAAPAATATRFRQLVKAATQRYTGPAWTGAELLLAGAAALYAVAANSGISPAAQISRSYLHAGHERMIHRREKWTFTAALSSSRIGRFEWGNSENGKGWYQGDGVSYLYLDGNQGQFSDDFWQTVDSQALPGITATSVTRSNSLTTGTGIPRASNAFNGGVAFANFGASIGADITRYSDSTPTLSALKSYFAFNSGVVALGSEIKDTSGTNAVTIIENRGFAVGQAPTPAFGTSSSGTWSDWAHIPGVAGYVLLTPTGGVKTSARFSQKTWSGKWSDINVGGDSTVKSRDYLRLDVLHGANPTVASYAYLIVPGGSAADTQARAAVPGVRTAVANKAHFATDETTSFAHFFAGGSVAGITTTAPAAVGWTVSGKSVSVSVSDPTKASNSVTVTFPFSTTTASGTGVTVNSLSPLKVTVTTSASPRGVPVTFSATAV